MLRNKATAMGAVSKSSKKITWSYVKKHKGTYLFLLPALVLVIIFSYIPLSGLYIAFLDYDVFQGFSSPFIGFDNIKALFTMPDFSQAIVNTVTLSLWSLVIVFPLPIIFAIMLNELKNGLFKRFTQTVSYLPHFISTIAVVGLATSLLGKYGIVNDIRLALFGEEAERVLWLSKQELFVPYVIILTVWKTLGWNSVIYLATMSGIDPELYDAAVVDGAGKFRQCLHVTLPSISTTIILLLILQIGQLFNSNFDLIYGLQNVYVDYEVISTVVYKQGITAGNYAMATALSFVQGVISLILVLGTNVLSKKVNEVSLI